MRAITISSYQVGWAILALIFVIYPLASLGEYYWNIYPDCPESPYLGAEKCYVGIKENGTKIYNPAIELDRSGWSFFFEVGRGTGIFTIASSILIAVGLFLMFIISLFEDRQEWEINIPNFSLVSKEQKEINNLYMKAGAAFAQGNDKEGNRILDKIEQLKKKYGKE